MIFSKNDDQYASFELVHDADGKVWLYAQADGALVADTPYLIIANEFGPMTQDIASGAQYCYVGVAEKAWDDGDIAKLQVGGLYEDMITSSIAVAIGNSLTLIGGVVADGAADYTGLVSEFAVCATTTGSAATTQDAMLIPERILTTA